MKRGISPIIGTVLIIVVTLIAAVAIGGFVFGIFGTSSQTANPSNVIIVNEQPCVNVTKTITTVNGTTTIYNHTFTGSHQQSTWNNWTGYEPSRCLP